MIFQISAIVIAIFFFVILCVIVQKHIIGDINPEINKYGGIDRDLTDEEREEEEIKNMKTVTECPDYWTPYYQVGADNKKQVTCVSDHPVYNQKMQPAIAKHLKSQKPHMFESLPMNALSNGELTRSTIFNMRQSPNFNKNKQVYYIPRGVQEDLGRSMDQKCSWSSSTCLPWTGVTNQPGCMSEMKHCYRHASPVPKTRPVSRSQHPTFSYGKNPGALKPFYLPNLYNTDTPNLYNVELSEVRA